jgi:hypothetical protein
MSEHAHQCAFFRWMRIKHPSVLAFSTPNGGERHYLVGAKLKREGQKKGMLDVMVASARNGHHGLFIEFKYGKNKLTKEQTEVKEKLDSENYLTAVVYTWTEAAEIVNNYLGE